MNSGSPLSLVTCYDLCIYQCLCLRARPSDVVSSFMLCIQSSPDLHFSLSLESCSYIHCEVNL